MYLVAGHFKCTEAGQARAVELMDEIAKIGRGESGIRQYTFYPNPDAENAFFLFEEWEHNLLRLYWDAYTVFHKTEQLMHLQILPLLIQRQWCFLDLTG